MLPTTVDLNATIVSMILTGLGGFSTPAGHIGARFEVGHDISLLIPEIFCRMDAMEREPGNLIAEGMLEQIKDFEHNGTPIPASRLGYRMTKKFVRTYLARIFDNPGKVFTTEILQPESEDLDSYADGILHIVEAQKRVAQLYFNDGTYESACPPLKAILSIMAHGHYNGLDANSSEIRAMFTKQSLLESGWYRERLETKQLRDVKLWQHAQQRIEDYLADPVHIDVVRELRLYERLEYAKQQLARVSTPDYVDELVGTIGADALHRIDSEIGLLAASATVGAK
jgi:hypothetical protein